PDPRRRARAIGIWVAASAAALAIGPLAGGVLVAELGWRSVFLVNVPVCVAGCILMASVRPLEPRAARTGLDLRWQLLVVAGIATLTFGAIEGDRRGWGSLLIVAVFAAAALCLTAFARREVRGRGELLRVGYFRSSS